MAPGVRAGAPIWFRSAHFLPKQQFVCLGELGADFVGHLLVHLDDVLLDGLLSLGCLEQALGVRQLRLEEVDLRLHGGLLRQRRA